MSESQFYFAIVSAKDNPLYEYEHAAQDDLKHLNQFILHASLDVLDDVQGTMNTCYTKVIDRFNEFNISAYVLNSGARFLILHESTNEDGIRNFFIECHELYLKMLLNPFFDPNAKIQNSVFDAKVKAIAKKYF